MKNSYSLLVIFISCIYMIGAERVPDTSEKCMSCSEKVLKLQDTWTNATTVAEILANLDASCVSKYPSDPNKEKFCEDVAAVFVQIPPSLFSGMDDLAWPQPEALCATLYQCEVACCGKEDPPEQVHLSIAGNDTSVMAVTWVTLDDKVSVVQYGQHQQLLSSIAVGDISTYRAAGWRGTIHRALMVGLKPGMKYYYRVGDGQDRWSAVYPFTTFTAAQAISYAVIADMDYLSDDTIDNLIDMVDEDKIQAVIHSGDISYADGYEAHWDVFFRKIESIAARVPYMVTPGNHEFWYNFTSYKHRFYLPGELHSNKNDKDDGDVYGSGGSGSGDGMYYAWNAGYAHFVAGNSETAIDTANFSSTFLSWLDDDLSNNVNRAQTPFVIAHFHRPMYCSNSNACTSKGGDHLRKQAEELLYTHQVNVILTGHVHSYERTYPLYNNTAMAYDYVAPNAPVHILQGGSGNREGNDGFPSENVPLWSAMHDGSVGFGLMLVDEDHIDFSYYQSRASADGGPVLKDHFTVNAWA